MFNLAIVMLQVGKRRERAGPSGMYAPAPRPPADRTDFYQSDSKIRRQKTGAEKHQRSCKTWTSLGSNGAFG